MNENDLAHRYQDKPKKFKSIKYPLSCIYLITGTLAVIGHISFFNQWPKPFVYLFIFSIPFYIAALTFTIFIHPVICVFFLIKNKKHDLKTKHIIIHMIWSFIIAISYMTLLSNGYIITA